MERLFVGRHGRTDAKKNLNPDGEQDARRMAGRLGGLASGRQIILLSSDAPRAVQTANIIRLESGLDIPTFIRSPYIQNIGMRPPWEADFHLLVSQVLDHFEIDHARADALVIAHQPLVRAMVPDSEPFGGVYEYESPEGVLGSTSK